MRSRSWLGVLVLGLLAACSGAHRSSTDGGTSTDAGTQGPGDAGNPDTGSADGGADAGVLSPPQLLGALPARGESGGGTWTTVRGSGFLRGVAGSTTEAHGRREQGEGLPDHQ